MRASEFIIEGIFDRFIKPKMEFNFSEAGEELYCDVTLGKETVGNFTFDRIGDDLEAQDINVVAKYRGQGIAKRVYDMLKAKGFIIHRSPHQTDDGKRFWDKNRGAGSKVWEDIDTPEVLYHATYRPLLKSIKKYGLGGDKAQAKWEDSKPGVVYLAIDPNVAESYAESSDMVPEEWLDQIIVLKIDASQLDQSKLILDQNVQDNQGDTLEYHGVIPVNLIT